ncbi:MAG: DegQ family serine endoprotease [Alphaproteobacteria bacterium]
MLRSKLCLAILSATFVVTLQSPLRSAEAKMPPIDSNGEIHSFADLSERLLPSVVNIATKQKIGAMENMPQMPDFPPGSPFEDFFEDFMDRHRGSPEQPPSSLGSGFIIDAEKGYIITNNHVIANSEEIHVILHNDLSVDAELVGTDEKTDIAVLKIDPKGLDLKAVPFGDSAAMRIGDWVLAIGNPFGLGGTVTAGIISARSRDIQAGPYDDFIQTDASINRGNSGGPMFNTNGEVIGINTAIYSPTGGSVGIGFAIPANLAKPVITQLLEYGRTRRGWLGVRIQSVSEEIAESLGLTDVRGALVASISKDSPAEKAGFEAGDIILKFNGQDIDEMRDLPRIVAETLIDSKVDVEIWRDGKPKTLKVKIGELEKAEEEGRLEDVKDLPKGSATTDVESLGLTLGKITPSLREQFGFSDDLNGVFVAAVDPDGPADRQGLSTGDVILEVDQKDVTTPDQVVKIVSGLEKDKARAALMLVDVQGQGSVRFVALKFIENTEE